jgi:contractile injection system tube protein/LysM domain-containing protein
MDSSLARATIINIDRPGPPIECLFNPKEYTFAKQNNWTLGKAVSNLPQQQYGGGQPATLQLQLFFDTYEQHRIGNRVLNGPGDDVRIYTDKIWELMLVVPKLTDKRTKKSRPPMVRFQWGKAWSFEAVVSSVNQRFTLFLPDGTPVRATVDVTFQQIKDTAQLRAAQPSQSRPKQNPTSAGTGGERVWTVREGDTLSWIAYEEYGDPNEWRLIADANGLTSVRRLIPGTVLMIPNG